MPGLVLSLGVAALPGCSDERARRPMFEGSETAASAVPEPADAPAATPASAAPEPAEPPPTTGTRYRVAVETTYFFEDTRHIKPSGQYLLRGDVLYGEAERDGFVKTRFVNPDGATVVGWLKAAELQPLTERSVARSQPARPAARPAAQPAPAPAAASADSDYDYDSDGSSRSRANASDDDGDDDAPAARPPARPASRPRPVPRPGSTSGAAVVRADRAYFHNLPDLAQPRRAHCVRGDKVRLGEVRGEAVYVTFTNWENVTTRGWMRRDALDYGR